MDFSTDINEMTSFIKAFDLNVEANADKYNECINYLSENINEEYLSERGKEIVNAQYGFKIMKR